MYTEKELKEFPEYWTENIQNDIYFKVKKYMEDNKLNRTQLADKLGFSKGYISQILNGEFNPSIKKYTELALATGYYPSVTFKDKETEVRKFKQKFKVLHGDLNTKKSPKIEISSLMYDTELYG